jgi:tetratricopeptide (TPR) repeat protein
MASDAAKNYPAVAGDVPHAQHMPAHVYLYLGKWDAYTKANETAWNMNERRVQQQKKSLEDRDYHSLWWWQYGLLQQGKYAAAAQLLEDMNRDARYSKSDLLRHHLSVMKAAYLTETGRWQSAASQYAVPTEGLYLPVKSLMFFLDGMAAIARGDLSRVDWYVQKIIDQQALESNSRQMLKSYTLCATAPLVRKTNDNDLRLAQVMALQLQALKAMRAGEQDKALALAGRAAALEDETEQPAGPPVVAKPAHELYGELLLDANQPDKALAEFDLALKKLPNRSAALLGKHRAYAALGDVQNAALVMKLLKANWATADSEVLEMTK